jgi:hypothetical protein
VSELAPGHGERWDDGSIPWSDPAKWRAPVNKSEIEASAVTDLDLIRIGDLSLASGYEADP